MVKATAMVRMAMMLSKLAYCMKVKMQYFVKNIRNIPKLFFMQNLFYEKNIKLKNYLRQAHKTRPHYLRHFSPPQRDLSRSCDFNKYIQGVQKMYQ